MHLQVFKSQSERIRYDLSALQGAASNGPDGSPISWNSTNSEARSAAIAGVGKTISGVSQSVGAVKTDYARAAASNYNGDIDTENAAAVAKQTAVSETNLRINQGQELSKQGAALAQSGFAGGGSQNDVMTQSSINANMQALQLRYQGNMTRTGLLDNAAQSYYEAKVLKSDAKAQTFDAVSSGLSGLMAAGGRYMNLRTPSNAYTGVTPQNAALVNQTPQFTAGGGMTYKPQKNWNF